jgi:hypothetical protein
MQLKPRSDATSSAVTATVRTFAATLIAISVALPMPALAADLSDLPAPLQEKIDQAQQACSDFEDGEFALEWGAITRIDLDGDLRPDWALDETSFACSSAVSLYCGTGGCMSHFLVGDVLSSLLNKGWDVVDLGPDRVLLTDVHGSQCGGINPIPCVTASVWDAEDGMWRSTTAEWEN